MQWVFSATRRQKRKVQANGGQELGHSPTPSTKKTLVFPSGYYMHRNLLMKKTMYLRGREGGHFLVFLLCINFGVEKKQGQPSLEQRMHPRIVLSGVHTSIRVPAHLRESPEQARQQGAPEPAPGGSPPPPSTTMDIPLRVPSHAFHHRRSISWF